MFKLIFILSVGYLTFQYASAATDKVICYYQSWSSSSFAPSDIDANICTHVNYAFLGIKSDGSLRLDGDDNVIKKLSAVKKKHSKLKLLFSVGGWSEGSSTFSSVAGSSTKKAKMASSAIEFLKKYKFDGIDIDWEYPAKRGGKSADKKNFVDMLKVLRKKLKAKGYLLTVAVGSGPESDSYDVSKIAQQVDFINVMTYDFHGASEGKTGQNAPLYASSKDSKWEKDNANSAAAMKNWKNKGAPTSKLILGLAFYGHSYKLKNSKNHNLGDPISGDNGQLAYSQICKLKDGWKEVWDSQQKVPYKYKGTTWIGFDNPRSIKEKVKYAKKQKFGGVMMWAVDQDDKSGSCGTKHALLQEIKKNL
ncbi:acidic mammalian chitinase-like [Tenebrio molitor]|jgi:chitinase|uniref:acidic mammalian chitinase-like n=1 Tax=Tenebrio molitor TaxID=7067 RepID=UPI00362490DB